jgi:hypothetical protein
LKCWVNKDIVRPVGPLWRAGEMWLVEERIHQLQFKVPSDERVIQGRLRDSISGEKSGGVYGRENIEP